jgi:hypothetical protein
MDTEPATKSTVIETLDIDGKVLTREISTCITFWDLLQRGKLSIPGWSMIRMYACIRGYCLIDYGGTMSSDYNKIYTKDTVSIVYDPTPPGSEKKRYKSKDLKTS